jgi:hypothetical protein
MAQGMSRRDKFILQFIVWLAVGTFLFGIWAMAIGFRKPATKLTPPPSTATTNDAPAAAPQ